MVVSPGNERRGYCYGLQCRIAHMSTRRILWVAALLGAILGVVSTPVFAQTPQPSKPAAPAVTTPAKPANPTAPAPVVNKINLNTATATELDTLPQIGPARAKVIVEARAKGKFKNWDDFVARKVVPSNAVAAIKDLVSF
jgi:competence protein ComEA